MKGGHSNGFLERYLHTILRESHKVGTKWEVLSPHKSSPPLTWFLSPYPPLRVPSKRKTTYMKVLAYLILEIIAGSKKTVDNKQLIDN